MEIKHAKQNSNIIDIIGRYVPLKKEGAEHVGRCPFHDDEHESLKVNDRKQIFKCFACGAGGDSIDFLTKYGRTFKEALAEVNDPFNSGGGVVSPEHREAYKPKPRIEWRDATPTEPPKEIRHWELGLPNRTWPYRNAKGTIIGYAVRFDRPDGKQVLPFTFKTDGTRSEWRWQGFDRPRPMYNLHLLESDKDRPVMVVEGEKTADAVTKLLPTVIATTWVGGADGIKAADLSPLHGRKVILWPDNDFSHKYGDKHPQAGQLKPFHEQPGNKAMLAIAEEIKGKAKTVKWVKNPANMPCGWDVADADWTTDIMQTYVRENMINVPSHLTIVSSMPEAPAVVALNDITEPVDPSPPPPPDEEDEDNNHKHNMYFKVLGYEKAETGSHAYYFYAYTARTVIRLAPSALTKPNLMQLAPINFWEAEFPGARSGINIDWAQNWLIQRAHDVGVFNEKWIRGRGAWIDSKSVVIHAGNHLVVNGARISLSKFQSKFIYEIGDEMDLDTADPLQNKDATRLLKVVQLLNWDREISPYLLAGFCVVAPVCGALQWRPHIWLTGAAGTGKSWVFKNIVRRLIGESALSVQGETSEAGLRQLLKHDALPVVFDEAEGEDRRAQERMQDVLSLMRAASASDGGIMAKGTAGGMAKTYRIRSCFAFASIAVQVAQQSDRTRVSILSLRKPNDENKAERWKQLQEIYHETITDDFCARLRARTISILPTILKNAHTFSNAAALVLGEQRTGDQLGALLAGAYSLTSSKEITFQDAVKWVKNKDWSEEKAQDGTRDEIALLDHILDHLIRVETGQLGIFELSVGELIQTSFGWKGAAMVTQSIAEQRLNRIGIKTEFNHILISNSSAEIKKILANTPWSRNHNKILMRIDGAEAVESTKFSSGVKTRAVKIPADPIFNS